MYERRFVGNNASDAELPPRDDAGAAAEAGQPAGEGVPEAVRGVQLNCTARCGLDTYVVCRRLDRVRRPDAQVYFSKISGALCAPLCCPSR